MLGARYGPIGTRFSILGSRIGSLKHLKKTLHKPQYFFEQTAFQDLHLY